MFRKSTWLLLVCGMLAAGCPIQGGGGGYNGNDNGNNNGNDNGNDNGDGGELPQATVFSASLDGAQETPPVVTDASGQGTATLSDDQLELVVQVTATGLSGPVVAAHIHNGPAGVPGDVLFNLTDAIVEEDGIVTINTTIMLGELSPDFSTIMALFLGRLYFNLHTDANPNGEIRGQLIEVDDTTDDGGEGNDNGGLPQELVAVFEAVLDGAQEMPPVPSPGMGSGSVGVTADEEFVVQVMASELTGPVTAAHIHMGAPGVAGDVVLNLTPHITESDGMVRINATVSENDFSLPEGMSALEALRSGNLYFNLHTDANPAGEIRGQLLETDVTSDDGGSGAG